MKSEVMIRILFTLLAKKRITAEEISQRYNMSKRSAYRYLDELSLVAPIYAERGVNGGFSLMDNFRLPATFLSEKEYSVVLKSLEAIKDEVGAGALNSAIEKLRANSKNAMEVSLNSSTLMIDSAAWGVTTEYNNKIKVLAQCVENSLAVTMEYYDADGKPTKRTIEPHVLVLKQGIWYIYAYCTLRCDFRLFKVGRISNMIVESTVFTRRDTSALKNAFSYRDTLENKKEVVLKVNKSVLSEVEEWLGVECSDKKPSSEDGEEYTVRAILCEDSGLVSKIMSYGGKVKVSSPESLKRQIVSCANQIIKNYQ